MPDSFNRNGTIVSNQKEIANNLNEYFVNVSPRLARKISEQSTNYKAYLTNSDNNSIFFTSNNGKGGRGWNRPIKGKQGHGIWWSGLKSCQKDIKIHSLTSDIHIYNQSNISHWCGTEWAKTALVTPVFKANERHQFKNYRQIYLFSRVLAKY